jgi:hypothetical protein
MAIRAPRVEGYGELSELSTAKPFMSPIFRMSIV